jgi:hypothetical protein
MSRNTTVIMPRKPPKDRVVLLSERAMLVADLGILSAKEVLSSKRRKDVIDALERTDSSLGSSFAVNFKKEIEAIEENAVTALTYPRELRRGGRAADVRLLVQIVNAARTMIAKRIEMIDKQLATAAQQAAV